MSEKKTPKNPVKTSGSRSSLGKKIILIDGNAIIHRAYHALPPLTTKKGELVNAVYGFTSTLLSVIDQFKPDYIAASFDLAGPTFRHEQYGEYKAHRVKADQELYDQIPRVKEVVRAFNIPIYEKQGFEADDIIGTIARQVGDLQEEIETIIVTGDMDTLQLVNDKTKVFTMRRGLSDSVIYDKEKIRERYNLTPEQLIEFKGLRGDPSDNIPGVKGIGEKTAITLLNQYQTIAGVYQHISEIKGAVKEKLEKDKAQALLSRELATINLKVPIEFELEKAHLHDFDREKIVSLLGELNFFSLIKRLPTPTNYKSNTNIPIDAKREGVADFKYIKVEDSEVDNVIKELSEQNEISINIQKSENQVVGISFSYKTGRVYYFPYSHESLQKLKSILENENIKKIGYALKSIYKDLAKENITLGGIYFDLLLAAYVVDPGRPIDFAQLVFSNIGEEMEEENKKGQLSILDQENDEKIFQRACKKADYCLKLKYVLDKNISEISDAQKKKGGATIRSVFEKIEMPLVKILAKMELKGTKLNTIIFEGISEKIEARLKKLESSIHKHAGCDFNINSPAQLADVLFNKLSLSTTDIKKGKKGYSTAASELEKLRSEHKIIEKIEEYREIFKLKTTYLDTLPLLVDENSRIHTTFNQAVTATGRLSSTEPNLQNIPIKTELGQLLRTAFVADDDCVLISADYSQIDLRAVAHVSNDKKLIEAFKRGDDIHTITAAQINNVRPSEVTQTMRRNAKALNFGVIYGMSSFGFSQSAGISREQARDFIDKYMENFSGVAKYMKETKEFARKNGHVETILGRRRNIAEINSPNFQVVSAAERMAINMPIQGLSADIVKLAMIKTDEEFREDTDISQILQIHDEIILEVKREKAQEVSKKLKELMENVLHLNVPLIADVKVGENWGEI